MVTVEPTIWNLDPHTVAKHEILRRYLQAWLPILSSWAGRVNYIDGFAGPGIYSQGEEGSPIIALRVALEHVLPLKAGINFIFIEFRKDRADILKRVIKEKFPSIPKNYEYQVIHAEFAPSLEKALDDLEKRGAKLAPTFAFLDPFGFKGLPMVLNKRILSYRACELLITFMEGFVNRFGEMREDALNEFFGCDAWKEIKGIDDSEERKLFWLELYKNQLRNFAGANYIHTFEMENWAGQTLYYLIFATKHPAGVKVMKEAMWGADRTGSYRFSDRSDPRQKLLLDYLNEPSWVPAAGDLVAKRFVGQTVTRDKIEEYLILETPYLYRAIILNTLENEGRITKVDGRKRRGGFPKGCKVTFR